MILSDYVELNPRVTLPKDANVPFVSMDIVTPGTRRVYPVQERPATGSGSKFAPGDTLFARITPCLENGKIAQYSGDRPGMGSTEFFVLRARDGISDPAYVYYFSQNKDLRSAAEKSMSGASGRQRAVISSLSEFECEFPPFPVQQRIAGILSAYDELIENSQRRIKILESMARALYREWFVHFRFPGHDNSAGQPNWTAEGCPEGVSATDGANQHHPRVGSSLGEIPQGWEVKAIQDFGKVITGKTPSKANASYFGEDLQFIKTPDMHGNMFILNTNERLSTSGSASQANKTLPAGSICVSCIGTIGVVSITTEECQTNQQINSVVLAHPASREFLFLRLQDAKQTLENLGSNGATMGNVNKGKFEAMEIVCPPFDLLTRYHQIAKPMFTQILALASQIQNLRRTRDLLLPRLLSGQIEVEVA